MGERGGAGQRKREVKVWEGQEKGSGRKKPQDAFRESQTATDGEQRRDYREQERWRKK